MGHINFNIGIFHINFNIGICHINFNIVEDQSYLINGVDQSYLINGVFPLVKIPLIVIINLTERMNTEENVKIFTLVTVIKKYPYFSIINCYLFLIKINQCLNDVIIRFFQCSDGFFPTDLHF